MRAPKLTDVAPVNHEFMAVSGKSQGWGRGATRTEALKALRGACGSATGAAWMVVPKGARLDEIRGQILTWNLSDGHGPDKCPDCNY